MEIDENCENVKANEAEKDSIFYNGFYENAYKTSAKVDIKSYFNRYSRLLTPIVDNSKRDILSFMGIDVIEEEEVKLLSDYCSLDHLTVPGEVEKRTTQRVTWRKEIFDSEDTPVGTDLETIKAAKQRSELKKEMKILKYRSETPINYEIKKTSECKLAKPGKDILVFIRVYFPFSSSCTKVIKKSTNIAVNTVISILGSQTLAELRDKITCLSDLSISKDVSDNLSESTGPLAKDVYKSGFFYIEGVFYNDTRDPNNIDYSHIIREWSLTHNYGPFETASMENTKIDSLSVRFGFPWVYQHQGRCEHIIVFSDARLFNHDDELSLSAYPRISRIRPQVNRYCATCGIYAAKWITVDNDRIPHHPCFFCDSCFKSYNYIDGKKIGNFKAYAYPCDKKLSFMVNDDT